MKKKNHEINRNLIRILKGIRVSERTFSQMEAAIRKHNEKSFFKINKRMFRRLAYEVLAQLILTDQLEKVDIDLDTDIE